MATDDIARQIAKANSLQDLQACLPKIRTVFSLKHVAYQGLLIGGMPVAPSLILSTCTPSCVNEYETRHISEWDPIVKAARQSVLPIDWENVDWSTPDAQRYRLVLDRHDVGFPGLTIPLYGPLGDAALFSFTSPLMETKGWAAFRRQREGEIAMLALKFHDRVLSLAKGRKSVAHFCLTPKVTACLELLAQGRKPAEIGTQLGLSVHTVRKHLNRAVDELSCQTKAEAVTRALALGLIRARASLVAHLLIFAAMADGFDLLG